MNEIPTERDDGGFTFRSAPSDEDPSITKILDHECRWCDRRFGSKLARDEHEVSIHDVTSDRVWRCRKCETLWITKAKRDAHEDLAHRRHTRGCPLCGHLKLLPPWDAGGAWKCLGCHALVRLTVVGVDDD